MAETIFIQYYACPGSALHSTKILLQYCTSLFSRYSHRTAATANGLIDGTTHVRIIVFY